MKGGTGGKVISYKQGNKIQSSTEREREREINIVQKPTAKGESCGAGKEKEEGRKRGTEEVGFSSASLCPKPVTALFSVLLAKLTRYLSVFLVLCL